MNYKHLVILDSNIADRDQLRQGVLPNSYVVELENHTDLLLEISQVLEAFAAIGSKLQSLHLVTHGLPGALRLGQDLVDIQKLEQYQNYLKSWKHAFCEDAGLVLYGCRVAAGEIGQQFLNQWYSLTGLNVSASSQIVGSSDKKEAWNFDVKVGSFFVQNIFLENTKYQYKHSFNEFVLYGVGTDKQLYTINTSNAEATPTGITFTNGTSALSQRYQGLQNPSLVYSLSNGPSGYLESANLTTKEVKSLSSSASLITPTFIKFAQARDGSLYAIGNGGGTGTNAENKLYKINPDAVTPTATLFKTLSFTAISNGGGDIAFDPQNENVFYITRSQPGSSSQPAFYKLLKFDLSSSTPENPIFSVDVKVGSSLVPSVSGTTGALAFGSDGALYATGGNSTDNVGLYRIDISALNNASTIATATLQGQIKSGITPIRPTDFASLPIPKIDVSLTAKKEDQQVGTGTSKAGNLVIYTVSVDNNGAIDPLNPSAGLQPFTVNGINIKDIIPSTLENVIWSREITNISGNPVGATISGTTNIDDVISLDYKSKVTYTITGKIKAGTTGALTNTVNVSISSGFNLLGSTGNTLTASDTVNVENALPETKSALFTADPTQPVMTLTGLGGTDPDGTIASYNIKTIPSVGELFYTDGSGNQVKVNAGDSLTPTQLSTLVFKPPVGWTNSFTEFTYAAVDNLGKEDLSPATVSLESAPPVNVPPQTVGPETIGLTTEISPGTETPIKGLGGTDPDGTVTKYKFSNVPDATKGVLTYVDASGNQVTINNNDEIPAVFIGTVTFTPTAGFTSANFTYAAIDDNGLIDPTPATIELKKGNAFPETTPTSKNVGASSEVNIGKSLGGSDPDGTIDYFTIDTIPNPAQGTLFLGNIPITAGTQLSPAQLKQLVFKSTSGFTSADFTYSATDNKGAKDPTPAKVNLGKTDLPETVELSTEVIPGTAKKLEGLGGSDPDGTVTKYKFSNVPDATKGVLTYVDASGNQVTINNNDEIPAAFIGTVTFTPTAGFTGASFTYAAIDDNGAIDLTPATVNLTAPSLANTVPETTATSKNVSASSEINIGESLGGSDPDGTIDYFTIDTIPDPKQGTLFLGNTPIAAGTKLSPAELKQLVFKSESGFTEVKFTYSATDNKGAKDPTPAEVILNNTNNPPETKDVNLDVKAGETIKIPGLGGTDDGSVESFLLKSLPDKSQGTLYIGDPAKGVLAQIDEKLTHPELESLTFVATSGFTGATFDYVAVDDLDVVDPTPAKVTLGKPTIPPTTPPPQSPDDALQELLDRALGTLSPPPTPAIPAAPATPSNTNAAGGACPSPPLEVKPAFPDRSLEPTEPATSTPPTLTIDTLPITTPTILGSPDRDIFTGDDFNNDLRGEAGNDAIRGGAGDDFIRGGISNPTPVGAERDRDELAGNTGNDVILANEGQDTVFAGKDHDWVLGGKDDDRIWGDLGNDTLAGEEGNDILAGDELDPAPGSIAGQDLIYGNSGNDSLNGNGGNDSLSGGADSDLLDGGKGDDLMWGDSGNDTLRGNRNNDTIFGGNSELDVTSDDNDVIHGETGDDYLLGGSGQDVIYGGKDHDRIWGGANADLLYGDLGGDTVAGNDGNDTVIGSNGIPGSIDREAGDLLSGGAGNDLIRANDGNDTIEGGSGNDDIRAGRDRDLVYGGDGSDLIKGELGEDTILGDGRDTVAGAEADFSDFIFGNTENDLIHGGQGHDTIFAGQGDDHTDGGSGDDLIYGDRGKDTLHGSDGSDTIAGDTADRTVRDRNGDDLIFGGNGSDLLLGGEGNDFVVSGDGDDTARGGKNDDFIWGNAGNDRLFGDIGNDTICGGLGNDTVIGYNGISGSDDGNDLLFGANGDDLIIGNVGNDTLTGENNEDCIFGGQGNDSLNGGADNDLLIGDRGNDTLIGGSGADRFVLAVGKGVDRIQDFEIGIDRIGLDSIDFNSLSLIDGNDGAEIWLGSEQLAIVAKAAAAALTFDHFTTDITCAHKGSDTSAHSVCPAPPRLDTLNLVLNTQFERQESGDRTANIFVGSTQNDSLIGGLGDDQIRGGFGNDRLQGGDLFVQDSANDRDLLAGNQGQDQIFGNEGNDTIFAGQDDDLVFAGQDNDLVFGDLGNDTLLGDRGSDSLYGGLIDPSLPDLGRDLILGGSGADLLQGNRGNDSIAGGADNDTLYGGQDQDILWGEAGDDVMTGDLGDDSLCGGDGNDTIAGANGNDKIGAGSGNDFVTGDDGEDLIMGEAGDDQLDGGNGDDQIDGGDGNDTLIGGLGRNSLTGGQGNDQFVLSAATDDRDQLTTITDWQAGDQIALVGGLSFEQLSLSASGNNINIAVNDRPLASVLNVNLSALPRDRFVTVQ